MGRVCLYFGFGFFIFYILGGDEGKKNISSIYDNFSNNTLMAVQEKKGE